MNKIILTKRKIQQIIKINKIHKTRKKKIFLFMRWVKMKIAKQIIFIKQTSKLD